MAAISPIPKLQFFDANGAPLSGGKLYTYLAGSSTPLATFTDSTGATSNTNPVILDSRGEAAVWLSTYQYKFVLKSAADAAIYTVDNITGVSGSYTNGAFQMQRFTATAGQTLFTLTTAYIQGAVNLIVYTNGKKESVTLDYTETSTTSFTFLVGKSVGDIVEAYIGIGVTANAMDSSSVGYIPAGTGNVPTNVQTKLRESVSVKDFGAVGDGTTDDTAAIQLALNAVSTGGEVIFPAGTYIASVLSLTYSCSLRGAGMSSTSIKLKGSATANTSLLTTNYMDNITITGIYFNGNGANQTYTADNGQNGILVRNSTNVVITECRFKEWGKDAIELYSDSVAADPVNNVIISNNLFESPRRAGVTVISGKRITIANNIFSGTNSYGAVVTNCGVTWEPDASSDTLADLTVSGNKFDTMLAGCRITGAGAGASINNIIIDGNTFTNITGEAGVVIHDLGNAGATVSNNRFKGCGNVSASANSFVNAGGVYFTKTNYAIITENWFDACINNGYGTVYADEYNDRCQIKNNTFINDGRNGIQINRNSATTRGDGTYKQITGNIMVSGGQAIANTYYGILVTSTGGAGGGILDVVSGNTIQTSTTVSYGIGISVNADDGTSQVFGNQINGNGVKYSFTVTPGQCEYTAASTACTGALTNAVVWKAVKIGRVVTLTLPNVLGTTTNLATIEFGVDLPAPFRPLVTQYFVSLSVVVNNVAIATPGMVGVNTSGHILCYRDGVASTGWGTAANTGIIDTSVSWVV